MTKLEEIEGGLELVYCRACNVDDCKRLTEESTSGCVTSKGFVYSAFQYLHSRGCVIEVEGELPSYTPRSESSNLVRLGFAMARRDMLRAGPDKTLPLVEG